MITQSLKGELEGEARTIGKIILSF